MKRRSRFLSFSLTLVCTVGVIGGGCGEKKSKESGRTDEAAEPNAEANQAKSNGAAKPAAKKDAVPEAYRSGMKAGLAHARAGMYKQAAAEFGKAAKALPGDARAFSELSWALFKSGNLAAAKKAAENSISNATGKLKAASLYNLGRVLEAQEDPEGATAAYRRSLNLRPNATVGKRLANLQKGASAEALATSPLAGPYADLKALCEAARDADGREDGEWKCPGTKTVAKLQSVKDAPFLEVSKIQLGGEDEFQGRIAVKTAAGWFATESFYELIVPGMRSASGEIANAVVKSAAGKLVLRIDAKSNENARFESWTTEQSLFCAVDRSGKLRCTPFVATKADTAEYDPENDDPNSNFETSTSFNVVLGTDGVLEVTSVGKVPFDYRDQLGKHQLDFK